MWADSKRHVLWLALLVAALAIVTGFTLLITPPVTASLESASRLPPPIPTLTTERVVQAIADKQFSVLVSYTDQGFEPAQTTIEKGETIRFTNNSTGAMTISIDGAPTDLPPGEYWEYTSTTQGDRIFAERGSGFSGVVHVQ
ncbi:MAG: hypothetical protein AAB947_00925 [Patescibacteria group bacterium]